MKTIDFKEAVVETLYELSEILEEYTGDYHKGKARGYAAAAMVVEEIFEQMKGSE